MNRRRSPSTPRGFALLVVLWTLPLLALVGAQLTASGRFETRLAANLRRAARAEALADGAVRDAIFQLVVGRWPADSTPRVLALPGGTAIVRITDQAGRIDPNHSPPELMAALLRQLGQSQADAARLAKSLQQWRQESDELPALAAAYRAAGLAYAPTGKPFRSIGEMGLVLGMTPNLLAALAPHVSVFRELDPDPRFADPVVIAALRSSGTATDPTRLGDPRTRPLIADIEAVAREAGGANFTRRAVVRIAAVDRASPRPWRILAWDSPTN